MASNNQPPAITLSTTTTAPITTTTAYTIANRRSRNTNNNLRPITPTNDEGSEPFPNLPTPTPVLPTVTQIQSSPGRQEYFSQPPLQYQVRTRPIGIKRLPSSSDVTGDDLTRTRSGGGLTRRRTNTGPRDHPSESATAGLAGLPGHYEVGAPTGMETIGEDQIAQHGQVQPPTPEPTGARVGRSGSRRLRRASNAARSIISKLSDDTEEDRLRAGRSQNGWGPDYESDVVDYLDVLDPEVSTLTTLTNVQNAMFVPNIPFLNRYINRRPTYELSRNNTRITEASEDSIGPQVTRQTSRLSIRKPMPATPEPPSVPPKSPTLQQRIDRYGSSTSPEPDEEYELSRRFSITSHVEEEHFAVLPHGVTLEGWSEEDVEALDDYVRHMLHSRRNKFKRSMKGFGKYVRKRKSSTSSQQLLTFHSTWLCRYTLRIPNHSIRFNMGTFLDWLDFIGKQKRLYCSHCRFSVGRTLRYHG